MADGTRMGATGFGAELDDMTLARARRGDGAAFEAIYHCYSRPAYTLALRLCGRPDLAEDVVQEAFLKAMEKLSSYRGDAPFGAWLKRLVANSAIDRLRVERRWVDPEFAGIGEPQQDAGSEAQVEALGLLSRMSAPARAALVLHELEGYSHTELAALFGRSESYSKSLLSRAIARLRGLLEPAAGAPPRRAADSMEEPR
jgi:RNA polymerase sigma factor (sigma-70 family)